MIMVTESLSSNGMNPKSFAYGSFSFYALWFLARIFGFVWSLAGGAEGLFRAWPDPTSYDGMFLVGRVLCIAFGVLAIPLLYTLCLLLYQKSKVGLIAAALLSFNVFHIQLSRFFTSDVTLTTISLAALIALVVVYRTNSLLAHIGFGVLLGIATATKISSVFLATPLLVGVILLMCRDLGAVRAFWSILYAALASGFLALLLLGHWYLFLSGGAYTIFGYTVSGDAILLALTGPYLLTIALALAMISPHIAKAICGLAVAGFVFVIAEPFAVLDFTTFAANTREQTSMVQGLWRPPYTIQYEHTVHYLYHLKQMLWYTMGWPVFSVVILGFGFAIARVLANAGALLLDKSVDSRVTLAEAIPLIFTLVFFLATARFQVKFPRYLLPLYPLCFLFAAALFSTIGAREWRLLKGFFSAQPRPCSDPQAKSR
jgi:4-amino-4-deoxy-L-arabinose transferase-like glycosyltransferase